MTTPLPSDTVVLLKMVEDQAKLLASMHRYLQTLQGLLKVAMKTSDGVSAQYHQHIAHLTKLRDTHLASLNAKDTDNVNESGTEPGEGSPE